MPNLQEYKLVGYKWVFRTKFNTNGTVAKHKARLMVKGFHQTPGVNFSETFVQWLKFVQRELFLA